MMMMMMMRIICCNTGEVIFNGDYPEEPPDFIFGSDDFLPDIEHLPVSSKSVICICRNVNNNYLGIMYIF